MSEDGVLDLGRGHVLTASDDDVLLAVGDLQVAVGVDHSAVADAAEPPHDVHRLGLAEGIEHAPPHSPR
jgi:hypothetical protein